MTPIAAMSPGGRMLALGTPVRRAASRRVKYQAAIDSDELPYLEIQAWQEDILQRFHLLTR
jgi:hypothetical protein